MISQNRNLACAGGTVLLIENLYLERGFLSFRCIQSISNFMPCRLSQVQLLPPLFAHLITHFYAHLLISRGALGPTFPATIFLSFFSPALSFWLTIHGCVRPRAR